jgi:hypothetical protein
MPCNFNAILNWLGAAIGFIVGAIALFSVSLILMAYPVTAWMGPSFQWASMALVVIVGISVQIARRYSYLYYECRLGERPDEESKGWGAWENLETAYHALTATVALSVVALATRILTGDIGALVGAIVTNIIMIITVVAFLILFKNGLNDDH